MTNISRSELLDRIIDAVQQSGWNVLYISSTSEHPFKIRVYQQENSYQLRIFIWNLSPGGNNRPEDEYRIQIHVPTLEPEAGFLSLLLGWWDEGNLFAAFDFNKHLGNLGKSSSRQIKKHTLNSAHANGIAAYDRGNGEIAIAFKPDLFMVYTSSFEQLHTFGELAEDLELLEEVMKPNITINTELLSAVSQPRQRAIQTISKKLRDNSFQCRVLTAYTYQCAFCGIQLKLVDAAHIVPVSYEGSTDETCNGISLCALHHRAYDSGLVTLNSEYEVLHSPQKMQQLKDIGHDSGMDKFIRDLRPLIEVPPDVRDRPHSKYVEQANKLRGW
ncbi:MAG: HNH endonuclease [Chloroflexota bacterium]|nr:HNH endonuclease [Chloroflexota bacterium]